MGIYFNPGNGSFTKDKNSQLYLDKTGLIEYLNRVICTNANCISVSHARRFGKSHAAGMIDAYYSRGCNSSDLFENTEIASKDSYAVHLNKYNVIHLDVSSFWDAYKDNVIKKIQEYIYDELKQVYGDQIDYTKMISAVLMSVYNISSIPFVIIIDEWDSVIRNGGNKTLVHNYLQFLHLLFKSEESKTFLALAYITGILPIKKINDMDFESIKAWYNGYLIDGLHMYNPNSVVQAMLDHDYDFYWKNTSSFESINTFITMNYAGLKDDVLAMLSGDKIRVNVNTFQNDITTVASKDDALTALIHLGYLAYDANRKMAYMPNHEVSMALNLLQLQ